MCDSREMFKEHGSDLQQEIVEHKALILDGETNTEPPRQTKQFRQHRIMHSFCLLSGMFALVNAF